jgi:hypothetical protein
MVNNRLKSIGITANIKKREYRGSIYESGRLHIDTTSINNNLV